MVDCECKKENKMKKAQRQKVFEALNSLAQAHEEIKEELCCKNGIQIQNLLSECQEFAISLGKYIEELEGKDHVTVKNLESYCETLYEIYTKIGGLNGGDTNENKLCKALKKQLIQIENSVKNDIVVAKEIVFLPYQASMWDSMESVWMAAKDDGTCDVYVIPIPFYERKHDGSLGEMHYGGGKYPDYVLVTDWQNYKIEERRPDVIYIQNPYDDWNLVTCVHPAYFSKELKKYTNMLVYLPYFVGTNDFVDDHFCITPGVMYTDRVIVQSEEVKRIYIDNIRKYERENNCRGLFGNLDKKILPLGSPKLDSIKKRLDSREIKIPGEWERKICTSCGERKKVVFYNTTIDALLKHSKTYMAKLKSVLDLFRQKKELVLLWRPHPLLVVTIKSMRPDLYGEYMEIVKIFQKENWGIYDESSDIDRAIIVSDAYYGDMSSVVELYKVTGKPIMIQNCEEMENV